MTRLIHDIRKKFPGLAKAADSGRKQAAIKLFCLECLGGSLNDARSCHNSYCPLWAVAGSAWTAARRAGHPTAST